MLGPKPPLRKRIVRAAAVLVVGVLMWIIVPAYIGLLIAGQMPASSLTNPEFVLVAGSVIIGLQVADAMTEGTVPSIPIESAISLMIAYFIWAATNGGSLVFSIGPTRVAFGFQLLVVLVILPSLWSAVRGPLSLLTGGGAPPVLGDELPVSPGGA